jgi:hypothetical protein
MSARVSGADVTSYLETFNNADGSITVVIRPRDFGMPRISTGQISASPKREPTRAKKENTQLASVADVTLDVISSVADPKVAMKPTLPDRMIRAIASVIGVDYDANSTKFGGEIRSSRPDSWYSDIDAILAYAGSFPEKREELFKTLSSDKKFKKYLAKMFPEPSQPKEDSAVLFTKSLKAAAESQFLSEHNLTPVATKTGVEEIVEDLLAKCDDDIDGRWWLEQFSILGIKVGFRGTKVFPSSAVGLNADPPSVNVSLSAGLVDMLKRFRSV